VSANSPKKWGRYYCGWGHWGLVGGPYPAVGGAWFEVLSTRNT
jgi:hypothetical protein